MILLLKCPKMASNIAAYFASEYQRGLEGAGTTVGWGRSDQVQVLKPEGLIVICVDII